MLSHFVVLSLKITSLLIIVFCSLLYRYYHVCILLCCTWRSPLSLSSPFVLSFIDITTYAFHCVALEDRSSLVIAFCSSILCQCYCAFRCVALEGHHLSPCHRLLFSPLSMLPHTHFVMLHLEITSLLVFAFVDITKCIHYHVCIWLCCPRSPFSLFSPLSIIIMFVVLPLKTTSLLVIVFCSLLCECYHICISLCVTLEEPSLPWQSKSNFKYCNNN